LILAGRAYLLDEFPGRIGDGVLAAALEGSRQRASHGDSDRSGIDPFRDILETDAASGKQIRLRQGTTNRLDGGRAKEFAGKELDDIGAAFHRPADFLDRHGARDAGDLIAIAKPHRRLVQRRRDDIVRSREYRNAGGLGIEHRACAKDKLLIGKLPGQLPNRTFRARHREGDLDGSYSRLVAGPGYFDRLVQGLGANRRDQSRVDDTLQGFQTSLPRVTSDQ
jgi:hypothetical protein